MSRQKYDQQYNDSQKKVNKGGEIGQKGLEILQRQLHGMEEKAEEEEEREREKQ